MAAQPPATAAGASSVTGPAFQQVDHGPVANGFQRLLTAYNAAAGEESQVPSLEVFRTDWPLRDSTLEHQSVSGGSMSPLSAFFEGALERATQQGADEHYHNDLRSFFQTSFPHDDRQTYSRPESAVMQGLFIQVPFSTQPRKAGRGSKGGVKKHECRWPGCPFGGTLQKCMDHFFAEHVKLKFFRCDQVDCGLAFLRKYDLDKHKRKQHLVPRPRERSQDEEDVAGPSRQTRFNGAARYQPYAAASHTAPSTQPHSTADRPMRSRQAANCYER